MLSSYIHCFYLIKIQIFTTIKTPTILNILKHFNNYNYQSYLNGLHMKLLFEGLLSFPPLNGLLSLTGSSFTPTKLMF